MFKRIATIAGSMDVLPVSRLKYVMLLIADMSLTRFASHELLQGKRACCQGYVTKRLSKERE